MRFRHAMTQEDAFMSFPDDSVEFNYAILSLSVAYQRRRLHRAFK